MGERNVAKPLQNSKYEIQVNFKTQQSSSWTLDSSGVSFRSISGDH